MDKIKFFLPMITGMILYFYGFFRGGLFSTFLMPIGGLISFVSMLILGYTLKRTKNKYASLVIFISYFIIAMLLVYIVLGLITLKDY